MKSILVPIDYSECSVNAVDYAIKMAKQLNANVHLCHALIVPELTPMAGLVVWPQEDWVEIKAEADKTLEVYIDQLKGLYASANFVLPEISYTNEIGTVNQVIAQLLAQEKFGMIIMGLSGAGPAKRFFIGSNSRDLIADTAVPILLIPKAAKYVPLKKIALATELWDSDLKAVHLLAKLFCTYNAEILLAHVDKKPSDFQNPNSEAQKFLTQVTSRINYSKIYYRHLQEDKVDNGLAWLAEHGQIDMLTMVHRQLHNVFERLVTSSHTQHLARIVNIPLLVLPEESELIKA